MGVTNTDRSPNGISTCWIPRAATSHWSKKRGLPARAVASQIHNELSDHRWPLSATTRHITALA